VNGPRAWAFSGAVAPGYPAFHPLAENFWPAFWKLYQTSSQPEAGGRKLPWRSSCPMPE